MMRAKMQVRSVTTYGDTQQNVHMAAVTTQPFGPNGESEDNTFARYTPMAELTMTINNPALLGKLTEGQKLYVDFTPAE
jgi:hypothetical protein